MRRFALPAAALLALAFAAPAQASYHLNKVNEVGLSVGGAQYVETLDAAGEPFPIIAAPFKLVVYNAAGTQTGEQTVDGSVFANKTTPILFANQPTVGGQARDAELTAGPLPVEGTVCFFGAGSNVHCLRWGNATAPPGAGDAGLSPGPEQSLQKCPSGAVVAAATPKANNLCTMPGTGGGGGAVDNTKPKGTLTTPTQKLGAVLSSGYKLKLKSNEKGKARVQLVRGPKILRTLTKSLKANVKKSFVLTVPSGTKTALKTKQSAKFTVKVRLTDAAGNVRNIVRTVTVKRS